MPKKNNSNNMMISSPIQLSSILEEINSNLPIFEAKKPKNEYEESLLEVINIIKKSSPSDKNIFQFLVRYQEIKELIAENERTNSNEEAKMKKFANLEGQINPIQDQQSKKISITTIQGLKIDEHDQTIENQINPTDNKGFVYLSGFTLRTWKTLSRTSNENSLSPESNGSRSDKDEQSQHQSLANSVKKSRNTFGKENNLADYRNNNFFKENRAPEDASSIVCISYKKSCP